jgi:hypothetical protein
VIEGGGWRHKRAARSRTCAGTADKTILAPTLTSPVATQATRLKTILPERVARFQVHYFYEEMKAGNPQISPMGSSLFTAECAAARRGRRTEESIELRGGSRGATGWLAWLAHQCPVRTAQHIRLRQPRAARPASPIAARMKALGSGTNVKRVIRAPVSERPVAPSRPALLENTREP